VGHPAQERLDVAHHRAWERETRQVGEVVGAERGPKTLLAQRFERGPGDVAHVAGVAFQHEVPVLGRAAHVERGEPHLVAVRSALGAEEVVALVQPSQGIFLAVVSLVFSLLVVEPV